MTLVEDVKVIKRENNATDCKAIMKCGGILRTGVKHADYSDACKSLIDRLIRKHVSECEICSSS